MSSPCSWGAIPAALEMLGAEGHPQEPFPQKCCMVAPQHWVNVPSVGGLALGWQCLLPSPWFSRALATKSTWVNLRVNPYVTWFFPFFFFSDVSLLKRSHSGCCKCCFNGAIGKTGLPHRTKNQECWNSFLKMGKKEQILSTKYPIPYP